MALSQLLFASFFAYTSFHLLKGRKKPWFDWTIVYAYTGLISFAVLTFGVERTSVMWFFSVPVVSYFILSRAHGFVVSAAILILVTYLRIDYNLYEAGKSWNNALINIVLPYVVIMIMANVYEKVRLQNEWELSEYALTDPLTGCYNRLALKSIYPLLHTEQQTTAALLLDIDHFKLVNDTHGHEAGDQVLKALSNLFVEELGDQFVFRIGGEEFLLIIEGEEQECRVQAEAIRAKVQKMDFYYEQQKVFLTFSGGFKCFTAEDDLAEVLKQADEALYKAKSQGRNRILY